MAGPTLGADQAIGVDQAIGWIGLGRMGLELATRLLEAGADLAVWNRTRSKGEPLAALGASVVQTPADLADRDVVVTMVSSSEVFEQVTLGDNGLLTGDGVPRALVDCSTVSMESSERVRAAAARRNCELVAAPVSGNPKVARAGRLTVVSSGPPGAHEAVRPILELFGTAVTYVGDGDRSRLVKICHNLLLGTTAQLLAETLVLAERGGVSRSAFLQFLNRSVLGSVFTRYKTPALVNLDYSPTFTSRLLRKDFELGLAAARELDVTLPVSALVHQLIVDLSNSEYGESDFAALLEQRARAAGLELEPEGIDISDGLDDADGGA